MQHYTITIEITDINDNSPVFKSSEMKFDVSEMAKIGSKFVLEKAADDDVGINGLRGYSLSQSDIFILNPYRIGISRNLEMVLKRALDREKQDRVILVLTALDGGIPQLSGTIQIIVTVLDANDNAPVCSQVEYKTNVREDSLKGTVLTTVSASDADEGTHGQVRYSISNAPKGALDLFDIDEENGVFRLMGKLDYEKFRHFEIDVQASDEGGNSDVCKVMIEVLDTNDNPPAIDIMSASSSIPENVKQGTGVTMMNVQDPDANENGKVRCFLGDHDHFKIMSTSNNVFTLVIDTTDADWNQNARVSYILEDSSLNGVARIYTGDNAEYIELNRERGVLLVKDKIDREAICAQTGPCALHFQVILENPMEFYSITVEVTDVNDNAPIFKRGEMKFKISESVITGTVFMLEQAIDLDVGVNGLQSYLLKPTDNFVLKVQNQADGTKLVEMLSGVVQINVNVLDSNDNAPVFTQKIYKSTLRENAPEGTVLMTVSASDLDEGSNGKISFTILNSVDDASEIFDVNRETGEIKLMLCGQTTPCALHFQVILENPMEFYTAVVEISDINDNSPIFEKSDMKFKISESAVIGSKFLLERAIDPDVGMNNGERIVEMILQKPLDREKQEEMILVLTAVDGGEPKLSGTAQIHVTVLDVNDNAPVFTKTVYKVSASDADKGSNSNIMYSISNTVANVRDIFEINELNGDLILKSSIDYEKARYYQIHVQASDEGGLTDSLSHHGA
uniref:Cadherin domain-containing protein n=1 Tax=Amphilophus citrinellus TaxID=61819 RepID=A0A3Q0S0Z0_AMPCI